MLIALDNAAKARASVVRSCTEMKGLSATEVDALKDLLRGITDQRKRMRAVRRLWQSLDAFERPSAELVEATNLCLSECRELASALDPWRAQTINQVHSTVTSTWARLVRAARQFTTADGSSGGPPLPRVSRSAAYETEGASGGSPVTKATNRPIGQPQDPLAPTRGTEYQVSYLGT
jgi:hypothetical protein